jgi:two-component system, NtrC family, sensor kinase
MWFVRVGTRVTFVLLLALTPAVATYTYWSVQRSTRTYITDLKRETHATTRGLAPALENEIKEGRWDQVRSVLARISTEGTESALFGLDGKPYYAPHNFSPELIPTSQEFERASSKGFVEFERKAIGRQWFCRLITLSNQSRQLIGYLLLAQDWTDINNDLRARTMVSVAAALVLVVGIATIIPLVVRRYVSRPLAELTEKVTRFSKEGEFGRSPAADEVRLLTEEFWSLDDQLVKARADLLERHRRELELERRLQHAERLATIGTLASGLAHEIGTPMGVIRARAEYLLQFKPPPTKSQEGLEIIVGQSDRISRIVRMLLDYARPHESVRVACDVRSIIQHALSLVETEATRRNVVIVKELGDQPLMVDCDGDQLQQVFVNLAINALDAMEMNGGTFRVTAETEDFEGELRLKITFSDTGTGVLPEHESNVFDPFFTTKEPGKGTGMGLAVSQSIMRDHNGGITFDSGPAGTRFYVTMPMAQTGS